jgi:toxin-antitoxin system PIN domain toxin
MLLDANVLLFAVDRRSPFHETCRAWLEDALNGPRRVGLPWASLLAFLRVATNPRAVERPLDPEAAWSHVERWLGAAPAWIPTPGPGHAEILGGLIRRHRISGNLLPDAHLAALAVEHGLTVISADSDFARFPEVRWQNPLTRA